MTLFWILWSFDALIALVVIYFFFVGFMDGSIYTDNMGLWFLILAGLAGILLGSLGLMQYNYLELAKSILSVLAVPGFLYFLMMISMLFIKNWR